MSRLNCLKSLVELPRAGVVACGKKYYRLLAKRYFFRGKVGDKYETSRNLEFYDVCVRGRGGVGVCPSSNHTFDS